MIAWLQRSLALLALVASALWAVACVAAGRWLHVADLPLALCGLYAAVIAAEFALMRWPATDADDVGPRGEKTVLTLAPSIRVLIRAGIGEILASARVFLWRQPFAANAWPDRPTAGQPGRRGVVLVHGYFCNRGFWNAWLKRLQAQDTPFVAVTLAPAFGSISSYARTLDAAIATLWRETGLAPVVVAHSMGGLAVRHWWAEAARTTTQAAAAHRIEHVITLGTPHNGTWLARLAFTRNAREMRLDSSWTQDLRRREPKAHRERMTCYYSDCDNIVFPARSATLPDARCVRLTDVAHVAMAERPEPWQETQRLLGH